ncbi:MAG TPA: DUF5668 domain-containing protein [Anaerolineales bacterium]
MNDEIRHRRYRGSLVFPIVLIGLGIAFLLENLGVMTGSVWDWALRLWPVLLIAIGLDGIFFRNGGMAGSALLIGAGTVFLLTNFGYLSFSIWQTVFQLWPLLLVAIGFDIFIGRRSVWASLVGVVLILAILFGALWFLGARVERGQAISGQQVSQALQEATQARVVIDHGSGSIRLHALAGSDSLLSGQAPVFRGGSILQQYTVQNGTGALTLSESGNNAFIPNDADYTWDLGLNPQTPLDLQVNMGAGNLDLDLTGLKITALKVNLGIGEIKIVLPTTGSFSAEIKGAIGSLVVTLPQGLAAQIKSDSGLTTVQAPPGFSKDGNTYTSPDYAGAANRVDLTVGQAIGSVVIKR